jgi:CBS domain-containing protein
MLPPFHAPVWQAMSPMPQSVREDVPPSVVNGRLEQLGFSGLLVTDADERPVGTFSRTDLLREGARARSRRDRRSCSGSPEVVHATR